MSEDDHVVEPPAGHLDLAGTPIALHYGTLDALREATLKVDPTFKDDYDRCEKKLKKLSSRHLVFMEADPENACEEFEITPGQVNMKTIVQAAKFIRERRFRYWTMGLMALFSLIVAVIARGSLRR